MAGKIRQCMLSMPSCTPRSAPPIHCPYPCGWNGQPDPAAGPALTFFLGLDLRHKRLLALGCGPGHNAARLATRYGAQVTAVDLVGLQVRRAGSHYGRLNNLTFVAGHALHYLQASGEQFDAVYSVFGAVGLVAPELLLPAIAQHLKPGRTIAFSVPHPQRGGLRPGAGLRAEHLTEARAWAGRLLAVRTGVPAAPSGTEAA